MYLKDEIFFRSIWTNLKAQFTNNKIDDRSTAAFRKEREAVLTTEIPPGKNAKSETSLAIVVFLVLFFVILFSVLPFALRWWWGKKNLTKSQQSRRRHSAVCLKVKKVQCKYKKVQLVNKNEVHHADTLPMQRSHPSEQKYRATSRKELKNESPDDGCSSGQTKAEICAAPSSEKVCDFIDSVEPKSGSQSPNKLNRRKGKAYQHQRDTNTINNFLKTYKSDLEEANVFKSDNSEIMGEKNQNNGHLEAECNDFKSEEVDSKTAELSSGECCQLESFQTVSNESSYQSVSYTANDEATNEEQVSANGTIGSNSEYNACSVKEDDALANTGLISTPVMIRVLPMDITDRNLNTVERKIRFNKVVAALPIGYCVRKQLERGLSNLQRTMYPSSSSGRSSRTEKAGNRQSSKPEEPVQGNGLGSESCCTASVSKDCDSMVRRLLGHRRNQPPSCISRNTKVQSNLSTKTENSASRCVPSSSNCKSQQSEEYCQCGSSRDDTNSCPFAHSHSQRVSLKSDECDENETENVEVSSRNSIESDSDSDIRCSEISTSFENVYFS